MSTHPGYKSASYPCKRLSRTLSKLELNTESQRHRDFILNTLKNSVSLCLCVQSLNSTF